jgi:hypothetical protein
LLESFSHKWIEALVLGARARDLAGTGDNRSALLEWLTDVVAYCDRQPPAWRSRWPTPLPRPTSVHDNACSTALEEAGNPLLRRAIQGGVKFCAHEPARAGGAAAALRSKSPTG